MLNDLEKSVQKQCPCRKGVQEQNPPGGLRSRPVPRYSRFENDPEDRNEEEYLS